MVAKKKKQQGHYCRICSEYKANEQFSGKGHSRHICKECRSLPDDVKADMVRCNEVERAVFKCPMSRQDWELLEKYAKKYKDKESGQFAQDMLDMKRGNQTPDEDMEEDDVLIEGIYEEETIPFAELEDDIRYQLEELLADNINEFMIHKNYIPELYNKYAKDGLEIYQVSLDEDEHYWKTAAGNLPWVCVRDGNGVYSTNVAVYNVRQVPSIFLINRNNELKLRGEDIKDLEASVKSLL